MPVLNARMPLARQVAEDLRRRIYAGEFAPGTRLPSEADFCREYQVSRVTVRTAATSLEAQGLVDIRHGSGMYVDGFGGHIRSGLQDLRSITETIEETGSSADVRRVALERRRASISEAQKLDIHAPDDEIIVVHRQFYANDDLVAISVDAMPSVDIPAEEDDRFGTGSVFAVLDRLGLSPTRARAEIHAVLASDVDFTTSDSFGDLLVLLDQVHYAKGGRPVAYSKTYFVEGRFQFVIMRTR